MSAHGSPLRGLAAAAHATLSGQAFEGRFGRMFDLPPATFGDDPDKALSDLGSFMEAGEDAPKDGRDSEESDIPSLYTYFGQFVDHDLTLGPEGSFQKIKDPTAVIDFRTPAFDLDCVYGRGPNDQPFLYDGDARMLLGAPLEGGSGPAWDLPRNNATPARALIGDPRNDENTIVSQCHGLFLRFHNRLVEEHKMTFEQAQLETQRHYQYVVLHDFLPRIVGSCVLDELKSDGHYDPGKIKYYQPKGEYPFMPIEFSTAAYRFGHSMVRPGYRLNDNFLLPIFAPTAVSDLRGKHAMYSDRGIDWARFIDTEARPDGGPADPSKPATEDQKRRLQFAYKIDTSLVNPLKNLPSTISPPTPAPPSLARRNLQSGLKFGLPSGQAVADLMKVPVVPNDQIIIGKSTGEDTQKPILEISSAFKDNCPLWTYILAEAVAEARKKAGANPGDPTIMATPQLGAVGGRIVAEVFLGLMFADKTSLLGGHRHHHHWHPMSHDFKLRDFVKFAAPATQPPPPPDPPAVKTATA